MPKGTDPFHDVSVQNKKKILEFCEDIEVLKTASSKQTICNYRAQVIKLARYLGDVTFKQVSKKKMKEFFSFLDSINYKKNSQNTLSIVIRRFYRWLYELDASDDLPDSVRWLKLISASKLYKVDIEKMEMQVV